MWEILNAEKFSEGLWFNLVISLPYTKEASLVI